MFWHINQIRIIILLIIPHSITKRYVQSLYLYKLYYNKLILNYLHLLTYKIELWCTYLKNSNNIIYNILCILIIRW